MTSSHLDDLMYARKITAEGRAQAVRLDAGLSREEVARACLVSSRSVALWERAERRPSGAGAVLYGALLRKLTPRIGAR